MSKMQSGRAIHTKVSIRTVDTDVVIFAVTAAGRLNMNKLWVAFATGKNFRYLAAHEMVVALGPCKQVQRVVILLCLHWV